MLARIPADRLADLLDIAEGGIVTADARQEIVLFNRGAAKVFGYDPAEIIDRPLDLLIPPASAPPTRGRPPRSAAPRTRRG